MRELRRYAEPALKITCLVLAVFVVWQLAGMVIRWNPFRGVTVPELPSLASSTNSPVGGSHGTNLAASASIKGTNGPLRSAGTNTTMSLGNVTTNSTNSISQPMATEKGTNFVARAESAATETNAAVKLETRSRETNSVPVAVSEETETNHLIVAAITGTNSATPVIITNTTKTNSVSSLMTAENGTNSIAHLESVKTDTNEVARLATKLGGTNSPSATNSADAGTNVASRLKPDKKSTNAVPIPAMAGMNLNQPPGKRGADLSPAMQTRISKIVDSEILGPVMHPMPMALLGIAGELAFLRSASGQTGLVKPGDSLGELKLLKIGINRVLVEQNGQKEELMIFSGYGGDSLLQMNTPNENKHL